MLSEMRTKTDPSALDSLCVQDVLSARFGFADFRPGQKEVVETLLAGRSALAVFPTGAGKSLCYQLPALILEGLTVVVSPLIALMKDQIDALVARGIDAARLDSSLDQATMRDVTARLRTGDLRLLYVAPERFNNERFLAELQQITISLFAVDEAHCISEWGHNFRPDYLKLAARAQELGAERVLALTATATPAVVEDICDGFEIARPDAVVTGFYRPNLTLLTTPTRSDERDQLLIDRLRQRPAGATIVYVTLQRTAMRVASLLAASGLPARAYHAGMSPEDRVAVQEWWTGSSEKIVVATIAFGMGIDKADVRYVYHLNLPKGLESYSQEIGRAGRDGIDSICELLASEEDVPTLENFAFGDTPTVEALEGLLDTVFENEVGATFSVSDYQLSAQFDIRPLVLKTILTYLELEGLIRQGTPFYAGYSFRPLADTFADVFGHFDESRADFLRRLVGSGKTGRTWTTLDPDEAALANGEERSRIVAALTHLEQTGLIELRASDPRQRYAVLKRPSSRDELLALLVDRFERREQAEVDRIQRVIALVTNDGCQVNAFVGYFGEVRDAPCGHCSYCLTGVAVQLPDAAVMPSLDGAVDLNALLSLAAAHPDALGAARQQTRFLCGITSPATTRAKLTRGSLFGSLADRRFGDVHAWLAGRETGGLEVANENHE